MNTPPPSSQLPRFVVASGLTNLADGIAVVVWAWLASLLSRDPIYVALMPVALRLPWFLFALPAGVVTDRADRRRLILAMDIVRAVAFAAAALVWTSAPLVPAAQSGTDMPMLFGGLLVLALVVGTAEVFRDNAAQTMLPAMVPHDQLERANGRLWSVELVGNALLGPANAAQWMTVASAVAFVAIPFSPNAITLAIVLAAFEFSGLIWNTVSVSYRQRTIPDELLGRVNSIYRLLSWGMMPVGLLLSGIIVSVSESFMARDLALVMPFTVAAAGAALLSALAWKPLHKASQITPGSVPCLSHRNLYATTSL